MIRVGVGTVWMKALFALLGLAILLFIVLPPAKMVFQSDPDLLIDTLSDSTVLESIWLTLYAALLATVVGFVLGVPLAYLLARSSFPGKSLVEGLINVPIVVPHSVAGIALLFVFGRSYFAGKVFGAVGLKFVDSLAGIVIAMLFVSVPFLIESAKDGFEKVDVRLERVARTLGASPWQTFRRVSFPLAWRSILTGSIMMWARGVSEFGAIIILSYHPMVAPILVFERFETRGLDYAQPVAVLLIVVCLAALVALRTLVYRGKRP